MKTRICLVGLAAMWPGFAQPHPHVFVDTQIHVMMDGTGQANGIRVEWAYDDFLSLLVFSDMGLDPDGDGVLTDAEQAQLMGFDLVEWPSGFEGDLFLYQGGEKIALDFPVPVAVRVEQGQIIATHERSFRAVPAQDLQVWQYDPTYYVAYTLKTVTAEDGCSATLVPFDADKANATVAEIVAEPTEDIFETVQLGIHFADHAVLACHGNG